MLRNIVLGCLLVVVPFAVLTTSCTSRTNGQDRGTSQTGSSQSANAGDVELGTRAIRVGPGIRCETTGVKGPPSYSVYDIGKPGVPPIAPRDMSVLRAMLHYVHPKSLRFAFVGGKLAVFDASDGPCSGTQYAVLNAPWCNVIYVPADVDDKTVDGPGGCMARPRPWIKNDSSEASDYVRDTPLQNYHPATARPAATKPFATN